MYLVAEFISDRKKTTFLYYLYYHNIQNKNTESYTTYILALDVKSLIS